MKCRVRVDLRFDEEDEGRDFWHDVEVAWPKADLELENFATLERCYHDEESPRPCETLEELTSGAPPGP